MFENKHVTDLEVGDQFELSGTSGLISDNQGHWILLEKRVVDEGEDGRYIYMDVSPAQPELLTVWEDPSWPEDATARITGPNRA